MWALLSSQHLVLTTTYTSYLYLVKGRDFTVVVKRSEEEEENRYNETPLWKCCVGWSQEEKKVDLKLRVLMCFLVLIPQLQREGHPEAWCIVPLSRTT